MSCLWDQADQSELYIEMAALRFLLLALTRLPTSCFTAMHSHVFILYQYLCSNPFLCISSTERDLIEFSSLQLVIFHRKLL